MKVKKVFNNNILCAVDEEGNEVIVTGKGLGFQKHTGETLDKSKIEKTYRMVDKQEQRKLRELVEQIPMEDLQLTEQLVADIKRSITQPLNESLQLCDAAQAAGHCVYQSAGGFYYVLLSSGISDGSPLLRDHPAENRYCAE